MSLIDQYDTPGFRCELRKVWAIVDLNIFKQKKQKKICRQYYIKRFLTPFTKILSDDQYKFILIKYVYMRKILVLKLNLNHTRRYLYEKKKRQCSKMLPKGFI